MLSILVQIQAGPPSSEGKLRVRLMRYEMRMLDNGWTVWDTETNAPAVVKDRWQTGMDMEIADGLVDLLNEIDRKTKEKPAG